MTKPFYSALVIILGSIIWEIANQAARDEQLAEHINEISSP